MSRRELVRVQETRSEDTEGGRRKERSDDGSWNGMGHCGCSHPNNLMSFLLESSTITIYPLTILIASHLSSNLSSCFTHAAYTPLM
jgi:hypothetical protein